MERTGKTVISEHSAKKSDVESMSVLKKCGAKELQYANFISFSLYIPL
jgi:hypothetical protein